MALTRTRKAIATGAAAVGVVLGAAGIPAAATNSDSSSASSDAPDASDGRQDVSYTSSITAPDGAQLDGLATITADQASSAAVSATGGTAGEVELENENGNVVYGVEITAPDGTQLDVKVDVGNASVLAQEADNDRVAADSGNGGKDAETNDASETDG